MLLDGAPAFKLLDVIRIKRKCRRGRTGPRPWASIALRLSGSSRFESEGETLYAGDGSVIYIPEGVSFSRRGTDEELVIVHLKLFDSDHKRIEIFDPKNTESVKASFISLFEQWEAKRSGYQYRCAAILLNILSALSTERISKADGKAAIIMRGAELISSDFQSPELTVEAAAAASSVSPEYFRAIYKEVYGITPHRAIEEKRLEKACRLLETGDFKVARVAKECGFSDAKYFSTLFRARLGVSPRAYKKKLEP